MKQKNLEFTLSAIVIGIIVAVIMTAANVYLGLYAGMTVSASIPAAVISLGIFKLLFKGNNVLQSNIVQTMASAGESLAAGIIFTVPALVLVGAWNNFNFWQTTFIAISGGLLGVIFMIPLRKVLIIEKKELTYPEGVACASVLKSGQGDSPIGFSSIFYGLTLGAIFKFMATCVGWIKGSVEWAFTFGKTHFFFGSDISPALLGVGYIVGLEISALVFIGGFIGWCIAIPLYSSALLSTDTPIELVWTLWSTKIRYIGVGAMIVGGLASIFSVRMGLIEGLKSLKGQKTTEQNIPLKQILTLFLLATIIIFIVYHQMLHSWGMSLLITFIMLFAAFIFVAVSSYIVGLVGSSNNPVSGMTISTLIGTAGLLLLLGYSGESAILATLGVAAVVCCAACTSADCSQDLKTGVLVGATPKYQQYAQVIGVVIPAFVIAPILSLLHQAYGIGTGLKAPQATLFASIVNGFFGNEQIPMDMIWYGVALALFCLVLNQFIPKTSRFKLHIMPVAIGIYLPFTLAVPILFGGILRFLVEKTRPSKSNDLTDKGILISSGLIAGEAIMGIFIALLIYLNVDLIGSSFDSRLQNILSVVLFSALGFFVYWIAKERRDLTQNKTNRK